MLDKTIHKILVGMAAGVVIGAVSPIALAGDAPGYVLTTREGEPVTSPYNNCVLAPNQGHTPLEACGDGAKKPETKPETKPEVKKEPTKERIVVRQTLGQDSVNFDFDKSSLKPKGKEVLDSLSNKIKTAGGDVKEVHVNGHTDRHGSDAYNQKLSERRAKTVGNYLQSQGVDNNKIIEKGFGESKMLCTDKTKACDVKNRRVEVDVYVDVVK